MLRLERCTVAYHGRPVVDDVTIRVAADHVLAIVGPSGCGKTSLLSAVAGMTPLTTGAVTWCDTPVVRGDKRIGMVQQHYGLLPWYSVEKNVALGLRFRGVARRERETAVHRELDRLGLAAKARSLPGELSGGERQRVALARTLVYAPQILLLDEPFSAVDAFTREALQETVLSLRASHRLTIVVVTHSLEEAVFLSDEVGIMHGVPATLTTMVNPLAEAPSARTHELRRSTRFVEAVATLRRAYEAEQRREQNQGETSDDA